MTSTRAILSLFWSPRRVVHAAAILSDGAARFIGSLAAGIVIGLPVGALAVGGDESYASLATYFLHIPFYAAFPVFVVTAFLWLFARIGAEPYTNVEHAPSRELDQSALHLCRLPLVLPSLILTTLVATAGLAHPDITIAGGKPRWPDATLVQLLGSPWWGLLFIPAWISLLVRTKQRLNHFAAACDGAVCPDCAYELRGIASATCPECGATLPSLPALSAPAAVNP